MVLDETENSYVFKINVNSYVLSLANKKFSQEDFSQPGSSKCNREEDFDYGGGRENNIFDWRGVVSEDHCASLAASTTGGQFWTYKPSESRCWVKKTNKGRKTKSGVVSGNRACGEPIDGKISDLFCF